MSDDVLKDYKALTGFDNLDMSIVDGVMHITPSDAGLILLSMVSLHSEELDSLNTTIKELTEYITEIKSDNELLRNYIEELSTRLNDPSIEKEMLELLYPISLLDANGNETKLVEGGADGQV